MRPHNVLPLELIPEAAIVRCDKYATALVNLKQVADREQGYFMLRKTTPLPERFRSTFTLQNVPDRLKADIAGEWYLGRIQKYHGSHRITISVNDFLVDYPVRRCVYAKIVFTPKAIASYISRMYLEGSGVLMAVENYSEWKLQLDPEYKMIAQLDTQELVTPQAS